MTESSLSRHMILVRAAVCLTALAWASLAPAALSAGCSGLVTSRADWTQVPSFLWDVMPDRSEEALWAINPVSSLASALEPHSTPQAPRRCWGVWCGNSPALPAVPAGAPYLPIEVWAWFATVPRPAAIFPSRFFAEPSQRRPFHRSIAIFHPPRSDPRARSRTVVRAS
jgi:hypothetical protein